MRIKDNLKKIKKNIGNYIILLGCCKDKFEHKFYQLHACKIIGLEFKKFKKYDNRGNKKDCFCLYLERNGSKIELLEEHFDQFYKILTEKQFKELPKWPIDAKRYN